MLWQDLFQSCACETDPDKLEKLVFETEDAIFLRFRDLSSIPESDEFQKLKQAAQILLEIKIKKLGWSDPAAVNSLVN
jgi:hypothetical protein